VARGLDEVDLLFCDGDDRGCFVILSGQKIFESWSRGEIQINPFDATNLNPNSYNFALGPSIIEIVPNDKRYRKKTIELKASGLLLLPGRLYLGSSLEQIGSDCYALTLLGRSTMGRLGLFLNATADLGHVGCCSNWTLEMSVIQPLRIYPSMPIGQIAFWSASHGGPYYSGRYHRDTRPAFNRDTTLVQI
jgi:dCTP deaminase